MAAVVDGDPPRIPRCDHAVILTNEQEQREPQSHYHFRNIRSFRLPDFTFPPM